MSEAAPHDQVPDDALSVVARASDALALACWKYHRKQVGPQALEAAANAAVGALRGLLEAWPEGEDDPGEAPRPRLDSDTDIYDAFQRIHADIRILLESLGPHSRELAGLYTSQGRILADVEALKGRLAAQDDRMTAQNDRMNGIATDLQGLAIDRRDDR